MFTKELPTHMEALKAYSQFIICETKKEEKLLKLPLNHATFKKHNPLDPKIWLDYDSAIEKLMGCGNDYGLGFVLTENDPFFCLDLDECLIGKALDPFYSPVVDCLENCAIEVSQSGTGLHVWGKYKSIPPHSTHSTVKIHNKPFELYHDKRFIALTGDIWLSHPATCDYDATNDLSKLISGYFTKNGEPTKSIEWQTNQDDPANDDELIKKALNSRSIKNIFSGKLSFAELWMGDVEAIARQFPPMKSTDDYDASRADAALAQHLAFWCGNDHERILRLMHRSELKREKWEREKYLRDTISNAVNRSTQVYSRKEEEKPHTETIWHEVSISDIHTNPPSPPVFLINQLLPKSMITLLGGHGGAGKSILALQAAVCLAMGLPFFGKSTIKSQVLFFSAEDTKDIVRFRLGRICRAMSVNPSELESNLRIIDATEEPCLYTMGHNRQAVKTEQYDNLKEEIKSCKVLIIDNASDTFEANENERVSVRRFLRSLLKLSDKEKLTVLLLAHVDKLTARGIMQVQGYSGSTAWHNTARSRLFLTSEDGMLKLEHQKSNFGILAEPIYLEWSEDGVFTFTETPTKEDIESLVFELVKEVCAEGETISPHITSYNNAFMLLKDRINFPKNITRQDLWGILRKLESNKLIQREIYTTEDYKKKEKYVIIPSEECPLDPL